MWVDPEEKKLFIVALEAGIEAFNARDYQRAYEIWEARWQEETTDGGDLLQGLLQFAVALSKLESGDPVSASKLLPNAALKIALYAPEAHGININAMLELLELWQQRANSLLVQSSP